MAASSKNFSSCFLMLYSAAIPARLLPYQRAQPRAFSTLHIWASPRASQDRIKTTKALLLSSFSPSLSPTNNFLSLLLVRSISSLPHTPPTSNEPPSSSPNGTQKDGPYPLPSESELKELARRALPVFHKFLDAKLTIDEIVQDMTYKKYDTAKLYSFATKFVQIKNADPLVVMALSAKMYKACADKGHTDGLYSYWMLRLRGHGVVQDVVEALKQLVSLSNSNHGPSSFVLGSMYVEGKLVERNVEAGVAFYHRSIKAGYLPAYNALGTLYLEKNGVVSQDVPTGLSLLRAGAGKGDEHCHFNLWNFLATDKGTGLVERAPQEALTHLTEAASKSFPPALHNLGTMYLNGSEGVTQNYPLALKYFSLAAETGYSPSLVNLGNMYARGMGVPSDMKEAAKYYARAAPREPLARELLEEANKQIAAGKNGQNDANSPSSSSFASKFIGIFKRK